MDTKIQQFFDGAISAVIIFVTAYFFMSLSDMDAMTAVVASLALAFAGGALWRRIVRTDKRCKNYDAYLSRFIYRSPRQNAEKLFAFFSQRYDCSLCGPFIDFERFRVMFLLRPDPISANHAAALSSAFSRPTILVVSAAEKNAVMHAKAAGKNLSIVTFSQFAPLLDKWGALPEGEKTPLSKKLTVALDVSFRKNNAGRFFSFGGLMLALSALNGFSLWFLAFAIILSAAGVICLVRGSGQKTQ